LSTEALNHRESVKEPAYGTLLLWVVTVLSFFMGFSLSSITIALPVIGPVFKATAIQLTWVMTAQYLTIGILVLPMGRIADMVGIRKIYILGIILLTLCTGLAGFSTSITMLIVLQAIIGIGGAMMFSSGTALVSATFPAKTRGRVLGITVAGVYIGLASGPFLGGLLVELLSWRSIFFFFVPAGTAAAILLSWKIKGPAASARREKFDFIGTFILAAGLILAMLGFSNLQEMRGVVMASAGLVILLGFVMWERHAVNPMLNLDLFRHNRVFAFANLTSLLNYSAASAIMFFMSFYLEYVRQMPATKAGLIIAAQPLVQAFLSPFTGRLSDRIQPRILTSTGMALVCLGLVVFIFLSNSTPIPLIVAVFAMIGVGFALFASPNVNAAMSSITPNFFGVASALISAMRTIGQMLSNGIAMIILAFFIGHQAITPALYPNYLIATKVAFGVFAGISCLAVFTSLAMGEVKKG
jgi:EmrB/QacA subfamily drug resistance transporter